jgi:hypothetical protein
MCICFYNPSPKTLTWERLENRRLERLGLGAKRYSRHFQRFQREPTTMSNPEFSKPIMETKVEGGKTQQYVIIGGEKVLVNNSLAPFYTEDNEVAICSRKSFLQTVLFKMIKNETFPHVFLGVTKQFVFGLKQKK